MTQATSLTQGLPALRQGQPAPAALIERRAMTAGSRKDLPVEPGVTVVEKEHAGVPGLECSVPGARRTILHLHGGGYRMGEPAMWIPFGAWLAKLAQARVVLPHYRLVGVGLLALAVLPSESLLGGGASAGLIGQWLSTWLLELLGGPGTLVLLVGVLALGVLLAFDVKVLRQWRDAEK